MITSNETKNIYKALIQTRARIKELSKNAVNPYFNSKYTTLDNLINVVKDSLLENNLMILQETLLTNDFITVLTRVVHESGEWIETEFKCKPKTLDPQGIGAATTYGRRYALSSLLFLASEDDNDANEHIDITEKSNGNKKIVREDKVENEFEEKKKKFRGVLYREMEKNGYGKEEAWDIINQISRKIVNMEILKSYEEKLNEFGIDDIISPYLGK